MSNKCRYHNAKEKTDECNGIAPYLADRLLRHHEQVLVITDCIFAVIRIVMFLATMAVAFCAGMIAEADLMLEEAQAECESIGAEALQSMN